MRPAVIIVKPELDLFIYRFGRVKFGGALDAFPGQLCLNHLAAPVDAVNPLRRKRDFSSRQPIAGVDHHHSEHPVSVVGNEVFDMDYRTIG